MINESQRATLVDIIGQTDRLDKITVELEPVSRTVVVRYENVDQECFDELVNDARVG